MIVIGNGESRSNIDISKLPSPIVGCNAIYRDYKTDHLVCCDKRMMQEAISAGANIEGAVVYTREDWFHQFKTLRVRQLPDLPYVGSDKWDNPFHWGSGPYAVLIGAMYAKECKVKLIGFDLYSKDSKLNNIYKDTKNYGMSHKRAIDPSYWIYQIGKVFECFPEILFTVYQEEGWQCPKAWNYSNVEVDKISNISYNT
jgi:hypothetical protein